MPHIARLGDKVICPTCGPQTIVSASPNAKIDGIPIARIGDQVSCGSVIVTGSTMTRVDGRYMAVVGSLTSHSGVVQENGITASVRR